MTLPNYSLVSRYIRSPPPLIAGSGRRDRTDYHARATNTLARPAGARKAAPPTWPTAPPWTDTTGRATLARADEGPDHRLLALRRQGRGEKNQTVTSALENCHTAVSSAATAQRRISHPQAGAPDSHARQQGQRQTAAERQHPRHRQNGIISMSYIV